MTRSLALLCLVVAGPAAAAPAPTPTVQQARLFNVPYYAGHLTPDEAIPGLKTAVIAENPYMKLVYVRMGPGKVPVVPSYVDTLVVVLLDVVYVQAGKTVSLARHGFKVWRGGEWSGDITLKTPSEMLQVISKRGRREPTGAKVAAHDPSTRFEDAIAGVAVKDGVREKSVPGGSTVRPAVVEIASPITRAPAKTTDLVWYVLEGTAGVKQGDAVFDAVPGNVVWLPGGPRSLPYTVTPKGGPFRVIQARVQR